MARIQVVFAPLRLEWTGAYHQFLLYTRDSGDREYIRGGPTNPDSFASGVIASIYEEDSSFGPIKIAAGRYEPYTPDFPIKETDVGAALDRDVFNNWHKEDVAIGADANLDDLWKSMKQFAQWLGDQKIPYRPLTHNSNSVVGATLKNAGIEIPRANVPFGGRIGVAPWSPGSDNDLPPSSQTPTVSSGNDRRSVAGARRMKACFEIS